jgi:hypothetical protein
MPISATGHDTAAADLKSNASSTPAGDGPEMGSLIVLCCFFGWASLRQNYGFGWGPWARLPAGFSISALFGVKATGLNKRPHSSELSTDVKKAPAQVGLFWLL